jgi:ribonuclease Z
MSLQSQILGSPGQDNALLVRLDTGQSSFDFLIDCGEVAIGKLGKSRVQGLYGLFLSHAHMDHICGFDSLFRFVFSRPTPFHIYGPAGTIALMHCRFRGFLWNLVAQCRGIMIVHEVKDDVLHSAKFLCSEGFANIHPLPETPFTGILVSHTDFEVHSVVFDHKTDCLAFSFHERAKSHIDLAKMAALGLKPGKWCSQVKRLDLPPETPISLEDGRSVLLKQLKEDLLDWHPGYKITYVTDVGLTPENEKKLRALAEFSDELVIECTYKDTEIQLAMDHYHLTVSQSAGIAKNAGVKKLILFHFSDRYSKKDRLEMLATARTIHPNVFLPEQWETL